MKEESQEVGTTAGPRGSQVNKGSHEVRERRNNVYQLEQCLLRSSKHENHGCCVASALQFSGWGGGGAGGKAGGGTWVVLWVGGPTSAQVMIPRFMSSSPSSGCVLTAQSLEPTSDSALSLSLSLPFPCSYSLSLSFSNK